MNFTRKQFTDLINYVWLSLSDYLCLFPQEQTRYEILMWQLEKRENIGSRKNFNGHMTASAYLLHQGKFLMIYHIGLKKWLTPWGHWDPEDQELFNTAKRELMEEAWLFDIELHKRHKEHNYLPIDIDTHSIPYSEKKQEDAHFHHDFRFIFTMKKQQDVDLQLDEVSDFWWLDLKDFPTDRSTIVLKDKLSSIIF